MSRIKLEQSSYGTKSSLIVDDADISGITRSVTINADAGAITTATIEVISEAIEVNMDAKLFVNIGDKKYQLIEVENNVRQK